MLTRLPPRRILASSLFIFLGGSSSLDLAGEMSELSQRFCAEHIQKLKSHEPRSLEQKTLSSCGNWGCFTPISGVVKNPTSGRGPSCSCYFTPPPFEFFPRALNYFLFSKNDAWM